MEKVKTYQRYLRLERGLSANTLEAYMLDLAKLQSFLKDKNLKEEDVKLRDLEEFAATLYDLGIAPASVAHPQRREVILSVPRSRWFPGERPI